MLVIYRLPNGTSYHAQLSGPDLLIPRKGERVNVAGLGSGKVKSVEWVHIVSDPDKGRMHPASVDIRLEDWKSQA